MKLQEKALLHALLPNKEHLFRYLPHTCANEIQNWPSAKRLDASKLNEWAESIHFSWFCEPIKTFPTETRQLFLSLLNSKQASGVCSMLEINHSPASCSSFSHFFLMNELKRKIFGGVEIIDADYLPPSTLKVLLTLEKDQLLNLIDLLGVHDLSADLRQVVDKELLRKIYAALLGEQLRFLHYCSKQPMKWVSPKLGLLSWDGSKKSLQRLLHGRGLVRLSRALFDENKSLQWHLTHRLDTGRANIMIKTFRQKQDLALIPYFKNQVLHIIKRYKK